MTNPIVRSGASSSPTTMLQTFQSKPVSKMCQGVTEKSNEVEEKVSNVADAVDCPNTGKTVGCQAALQ